MRFLLAILLVCLLSLGNAAISSDLITNLPGFGVPPTKQYSGYLNVDPSVGRYLHYWFVESQAGASAPVMLWLNGGPGCSSLDGFFYEHGPFKFVDQVGNLQDGDVPALEINPYSWNRLAHMIYLESPAFVGFSYSNNPLDRNTNDTKTAIDAYHALLTFFQSFPEYSKNEFYVAGESYAGIYVPTLVDQIRIGNDAGNPAINLKGFMVGNGCLGNSVGSCSPQGTAISVDYLHGHGLYSDNIYEKIMSTCKDLANPSISCSLLLNQMGKEIGGVNIYNIYGDCINGDGLASAEERQLQQRHRLNFALLPHLKNMQYLLKSASAAAAAQVGVIGPVECIDGIYAGRYLNNDAVRQAIHMRSIAVGGNWTVCTSELNYNSNTVSLLPLYPTLAKQYRVLIYSGDADACVPYNGSEEWVSSLNFSVKQNWRPWLVNSQVAGYVTVYDFNDFTFLTVKGSGHMVPEFTPAAGFEMFSRFLNQQQF